MRPVRAAFRFAPFLVPVTVTPRTGTVLGAVAQLYSPTAEKNTVAVDLAKPVAAAVDVDDVDVYWSCVGRACTSTDRALACARRRERRFRSSIFVSFSAFSV